jgi:hypothetical protein
LPGESEWTLTDSKGIGFEFHTIADLLPPPANPHLKSKTAYARSVVIWLVLNEGIFNLTQDISTDERDTKRPRLATKSSFTITKTVARVTGETNVIVECYGVDSNPQKTDFLWKDDIKFKLPVTCVLGQEVNGPEGHFRKCFALSIVSLPNTAFVCKKFKEDDSLQRHINDLKTLRRAAEIVSAFQDKLKENDDAAKELLPKGCLKRMQKISFVDAFVVKFENGDFYFVEERIDGKYIKFTGNDGCQNELSVSHLDALSHFSFVLSEEKEILVDFQG